MKYIGIFFREFYKVYFANFEAARKHAASEVGVAKVQVRIAQDMRALAAERADNA